MSQLIKHYWINRETGGWAVDTRFGLMMPNIKGLEIQHQLTTENDVPFFLSTVPDYFEHSVTISPEQLTEFQNNQNITIISSTERQIEVERARNEDGTFAADDPSTTTDEAWITETVYDVVYQESHILSQTEGEGLRVITQTDWDNEILSFDARQEEKRYNILRKHRDEMLRLTDWIVIKAKEQGTNLSTEFKTWRQALRDLPSGDFPTAFPTLPSSLENNQELQDLSNRFYEVRSIAMINDPLNQ